MMSRLHSAAKDKDGGGGDSSALFAVDATALSLNNTMTDGAANFGDVVRPKYLSQDTTTSAAPTDMLFATPSTTATTLPTLDEVEVAAQLKQRNLVVAVASIGVALLNYVWQFTHPISPVQLLVGMQENSVPVSVIGRNDKPTVVDFWAPVRDHLL